MCLDKSHNSIKKVQNQLVLHLFGVMLQSGCVGYGQMCGQ